MRKLSLGFVFLFLIYLGASASLGAADLKQSSTVSKNSRSKKNLSAAASPQALGDGIAQLFRRKTGKELMAEKAKKSAAPEAASTEGNTSRTSAGTVPAKRVTPKTSGKTAPVTSVKPGYVPPPPAARGEVPQIRQEIQKIFELNKKVKSVQSGGSAQLQRVQEQARIHQKILDQLEASQKQNGKKTSSKEALIAQEKLRIIHDETLRNTQVVEDLKVAPARTVPKTVSQVTPKEIPRGASKSKISAS